MNEHIIDHYTNQIPILPGEFLPAYIARLNKMVIGVDTKRLMSFSGSTQMGKLHQMFPRVASCYAYRPKQRANGGALLHEHLGARYWRGFVNEESFRHHVTETNEKIKSKRSIFEGEELLDSLKPMKFCEQCHRSDKHRYGVSIWRASHQITSMYLCEEHNTALQQFHIPCGKSLLDYPVVTKNVCANAELIVIDPLRCWLDGESKQRLAIRTIHNRQRLKDLRSDMAKALGAKHSANTMGIDIAYRNEWRKFSAGALSTLCTREKNYQPFANRMNLGIVQQVKQDAPVRHPLMFILAMKFVEDTTGVKLS